MNNETVEVPVFGIFLTNDKAKMPEIAYEGTSACFDLYATETTIIPARGSKIVPNGVRISIPKGYYLEFADRSGNGIKKGLQIHKGIIDTGYTGDLAVKMYNLTDEDQTIEEGKGICQVKVMKIPEYKLKQLSQAEWDDYCQKSVRGENGFGSSDK